MSATGTDGTGYAGRMTVMASQSGLHAARRRIRALATELNLSAMQSLDLQVATGEALSNAYRHGSPRSEYGRILISWAFANDMLTVSVTDQGAGVASRKVTVFGDTGGRGITLMKACADEVDFRFGLGATVVLRKRA